MLTRPHAPRTAAGKPHGQPHGRQPHIGRKWYGGFPLVTPPYKVSSSWRSGVIEPARWAKSLNSRRQERVELNGRRGRVEGYNPRRRGAVDPGAMRSPGPCEIHKTEARVAWDPARPKNRASVRKTLARF